MVTIQLLNEFGECEVGVVCVWLALTFESFFFERIEEFLIQDIFDIDHLSPMLNLGCMVLDSPWEFGWRFVGSHGIRLWGRLWAYKVVLGDRPVLIFLYCNPKDTMLYAAKFVMNGWGIGLYIVFNLAGDIVVDHPLKFRDIH